MKTYVITLSKKFPTTHTRKGQDTEFERSFLNGTKIHTIRENFPLWEKRLKEVQEGRAVLSVRQWAGVPYRSQQEEIGLLDKEDGIGIQVAELTSDFSECVIEGKHYSYVSVAKNDGLHPSDWLDWFRHNSLLKPYAIIHFTKFRY